MAKYNLTFWQKIELIFIRIAWLIAKEEMRKSWHEVKKGMEKHTCNYCIEGIESGVKVLRCNHEGCTNVDIPEDIGIDILPANLSFIQSTLMKPKEPDHTFKLIKNAIKIACDRGQFETFVPSEIDVLSKQQVNAFISKGYKMHFKSDGFFNGYVIQWHKLNITEIK